MKRKLYILFLRFAHTLRLLSVWSRVYRFLFDRQFRKMPVEKHTDFKAATEDVNRLKWVADGTRELGDVVRDPGWVEVNRQRVQRSMGQLSGALDCDDFAVWLATSLHDTWRPVLLFVNATYQDQGTTKFYGHCVALLRYGNVYYHCGNWGVKGPFKNEKDVIGSVVGSSLDSASTINDVVEALARKTDRDPCFWAVYDKDLKLLGRSHKLEEFSELRSVLNTYFSRR